MPRELRAYLWDIVRSARLIEEFTAGRDFSDYEADVFLRSAVERQFEIIGEAMSQALKSYPELGAEITASRRIVAFRNLLIHGYMNVDPGVVWSIVEEDLPTLLGEAESLLASETDGA